MNLVYKNIKNVQKLTQEENSFLCDVDIDFDGNGNFETAPYCARPGGGGLCDQIIQDILDKKFTGKMIDFNYPTAAEIKAQLGENVRIERNNLLTQSDWTQLPDVPEAVKSKWAVYRQDLRNITKQPGFPENIKWPTKPN